MNWLQRVAQGYYGQQKGYWLALWVDPAGKIYDVDSTHHGWIEENRDLLRKEYGIDLSAMIEQRYEEEYPQAFEDERSMMIVDIAFNQDIEESQVVLSEEQEESLYNTASEMARERADFSGVELVDMLINEGWIRVAHRTSIHIEGNEDVPGFFDRAEMMLIERFSQVWKNPNYQIIINAAEISSGDLQEYGSLESAIDAVARHNRLYLMRR